MELRFYFSIRPGITVQNPVILIVRILRSVLLVRLIKRVDWIHVPKNRVQ
jgi:hypothetical protein